MSLNKNHGYVGDKIIIKETGEEDVIQNAYGLITYHMSFEMDWDEDFDIKDDLHFTYGDSKKEGWYYTIKNGKEYHEDKLIVGRDNIRDYKIDLLKK